MATNASVGKTGRISNRAALSKKHPSERDNLANAHQISLRTIAHCLKALTDS
jgi:hypothetical protein